MKPVRLLQIGDVPAERLEVLGEGLSRQLGVSCRVLRDHLDPAPVFHEERGQYHSSELLAAMVLAGQAGDGLLLGLTPVDLYIPILTFVFGEAQFRGNHGLVSYCRLRQEFYGLPADPGELDRRILKEAIHEFGHTIGLVHCDDYSCVMASSNSVEWIDLKESRFCAQCRSRMAG